MSKQRLYGLDSLKSSMPYVIFGGDENDASDSYIIKDNKPLAVPQRGYYFNGQSKATVVDELNSEKATTNVRPYSHFRVWILGSQAECVALFKAAD